MAPRLPGHRFEPGNIQSRNLVRSEPHPRSEHVGGYLLDCQPASVSRRSRGHRAHSYANNTITLSLGVSTYTPVNTDQIMFPNMGTPVNTYTAAAGSWRNGLYVFSTTTTSGSIGGLSYANAPELATAPTANGRQGGNTTSSADLFRSRRSSSSAGTRKHILEVIGICHTAQWVSASLQGIAISNWLRVTTRPTNNSIDIAGAGSPGYDQTFEWCGTTHYISRYAGKTRVDWVRAANFGWAQLTDIDFFPVG